MRPTLLLDKRKCVANIERIVSRAHRNGVKLRPHFKTHQSHEIARWFRALGVEACTVSSLKMAAYFAEDNWKDITVAFPVNPLEIDLINSLASRINLNLLVSSVDVIPLLANQLSSPVRIYIDIDTGYHRTGFLPSDFDSINNVLSQMAEHETLMFEGFLSHAGHTYKCGHVAEVQKIHDFEVEVLNELASRYRVDYPSLKISIGDTPSCSMLEKFVSVDEIRPGNLVFYDLTQQKIGSCTLNQISVVMACPVVAIYPDRNEVIIYGGGVHFSKDSIADDSGRQIFGKVVRLNESGWELPPTSMFVKSLSQEHGIIHASSDEISQVRVGDVLGILPVHSCLTADAMGQYQTLEGEVIKRLTNP